ncbi:MAG: ABC transporter substrate-binding protein [Fusobacteriaceae bacterium]
MLKFMFALLFLTVFGCGKKETTQKEAVREKSTVTVVQAAKPKTLDPPLANQVASMTVARQIFNTLVSVDDDGKLVPEIAEKWEFENPKSIVFTIKEGIKFHNGEKLTVEDVAFSLERMRDKAGTRILVEKISGVEIVDSKRVRVLLSDEFSPLLYNLTLSLAGIINKDDTLKRGESEIAIKPNGTGPFRLVDWSSGDTLKFEAFNESFKGKPGVDELIFRVIPEGNSRMIALETGEADIAYNLSPSDIKFIKNNKDLNLINRPSMRTEYVGFNTMKAPFDKKEFRQAVNLVLDREGILSAVYDNAGEPATSMASPSMIGGKPTGDISLNVEKAKELLNKIGFVSPVQIKIITDSNPANIQTAQIIQANLKNLGIDLIIEPMEWGTYLERTAKGEHEMILGGWFPGTSDSDIVFYPLYHSTAKGAAGNRSFYNNPEYDSLVDQARIEIDYEKRNEIYKKAQEILEEDLPIIPIIRKNELIGMKNNISNFIFRPNGHHVLTELKKENN